MVRCEAAVAEKEAEEASGEKFEYQAEVGSGLFSHFQIAACCWICFIGERLDFCWTPAWSLPSPGWVYHVYIFSPSVYFSIVK